MLLFEISSLFIFDIGIKILLIDFFFGMSFYEWFILIKLIEVFMLSLFLFDNLVILIVIFFYFILIDFLLDYNFFFIFVLGKMKMIDLIMSKIMD